MMALAGVTLTKKIYGMATEPKGHFAIYVMKIALARFFFLERNTPCFFYVFFIFFLFFFYFHTSSHS